MAILPAQSYRHTIEEAIKENPSAGPRKISLEEYRRKQANQRQTEFLKPVEKPTEKKRGGKAVRFRKELGNLYRLLTIATSYEERSTFKAQIREIQKQRKEFYQDKRHHVVGQQRGENYRQQQLIQSEHHQI